MPQENKGFLMKTYGGKDPKKRYPLSDKDSQAWPELGKEVARQSIYKNPESMKNARKIRPMNFIEKLITPSDTLASANVFNTIALNKDAIDKSGMDLGGVLTHELTHANQNSDKGLLSRLFGRFHKLSPNFNYDKDPEELEAYAAQERSIPTTFRDIRLPLEKGQKKDPRLLKKVYNGR
jgi:hypothetical protein